MLHCSKTYLLCLNLCSILTHYAQIMPNYLCLSSHALLIISNLWINNKWLQHKLTCQSAYHRKDRYTLIAVSYMIFLLELLTVLLEYIDLSVIAILISKNSYYYTNILPIIRHSSIRDFLIKKFSVYSPIEPWHKMTTRV